MSVTFSVVSEKPHCDDFCDLCYEQFVNVSNMNAGALLAFLGLPSADLWGQMRAGELVKRIRQALTSGKTDTGEASYQEGNVYYGGRRDGYCNDRANDLLALCERAGDLGMIGWG